MSKPATHVDNLNTISQLERDGFQGTDASLSISIFEYGLAWLDQPNGETLVVHRHPTIRKRFDRCEFKTNVDLKKEFDWVDWQAFFSFNGYGATGSAGDWHKLPLGVKLSDLVRYYGEENIFGSAGWEGFSISED